MVKQVGLLTAGCQPWNREVCAASGNRFAYCATLAIYIYELDEKYNQFRLLSILSEHKKTISAITWHPRNPDIFATASYENQVVIWDVVKQKPLAKYENTRGPPIGLEWYFLHGETITFIHGRGPLYMWIYRGTELTLSTVKDSTFSSDVMCFKWNYKKMENVAFGHKDGSVSFCTVGGKSVRHQLRADVDNDLQYDTEDSVTALAWDPLSTDYLLIANTHTGIRLVDSVSVSVIMCFQLPSAACKVKPLAWLTTAPGMFVTGDALSGNLRVWNVSKSTPLDSIRVKKTGFHALTIICDTDRTKYSNKTSLGLLNQASSTSAAENPASITAAHFALPPARVVCVFLDGGVGLYDLGHRKWEFLREQGHVETIFDCKFSANDGNILATGSFDGTIKLWDITSFTCLNTSPGNQGVIYTISWAPKDLECIVAGTSKLGMFIWDIKKGKIVKTFHEHGKSAVYTVVWNQKDPRRIMSSGGDSYCIIRNVDGELIQKYKHPGPVYGCDWCPHNKDMLATGCEDKNVRVYYTATNSDNPLKVFSGHLAKVFHVKWSPLKENLLCSGSDDHTIRVWDYSQDVCIQTLSGHSGPIRGLMWNYEIPYLINSGSWDHTLRMWDIRNGKCLHVVHDHGADVYGLTSHMSRPFILASSSRDSTVRLWSITSLIQPLEMNILTGKPWSQILGTTDAAMVEGAEPLLTGKTSKDLKIQAEEYPTDSRNRVLKFFSKFFMAPSDTDNLWELVAVVKGLDDSLLSAKYSKGITHVKHLVKFCSSEAQQLAMAKLTKFGGGIGSRSKEDRLREAAQLYLKSGNILRYCELMIELGAWERALAMAPGFSYSYWKSLCHRYTQYLLQEDKDEAALFCTATGDTQTLVNFYVRRGQMSDAVLSAQVACEGLIPSTPQGNPQQNGEECNGLQDSTQQQQLLCDTVEEWARWHLRNGSPVAAACCHLASDNIKSAMCRLIQGNELEVAVAVGMTLNCDPDLTAIAIEMLSRRCERLGKWDLAVDMLKLTPNNQVRLAKCCARCSGPKEELNALYDRAGLPPVDVCYNEAEKLKRKNNVFECVMYYLLSSAPALGLELGLDYVKKIIKGPDWTVDDVFPLLQLLGCIRTDVLQAHRKKGELLAMCSYIGGMMAIRRAYYPIVESLFQHARCILNGEGDCHIGITQSMILTQWTTWNNVHAAQPEEPVDVDIIPIDHRPAYMELCRHIREETEPAMKGANSVAFTHLPSHSDVHISCLTKERIQGLAVFLEDERSAVSPNEALMWARVNPFSPLSTGYRMNPF